jgi:hypothetical protein
MFGNECRFCSDEYTYRPYTEIKKENGVYKPISQGKKRCEVGQICNTQEIGKNPWISQMHTCPVAWSVARYGKIPICEKTKPKKKIVIKAKVIK